MLADYWDEFSCEDLDTVENEEEEEYQHCDCSNCMDCLGLSWSDFI